jgi:hypothetical protein
MNLLHRTTMRAASLLWILDKKINLLAPRIAATTYFECDGNCFPLDVVDTPITVIMSSRAPFVRAGDRGICFWGICPQSARTKQL